MANMNQRVGERIKQAREARALTQAKLARELGFSQNTIAGWESGRRSCRLETLEALSSVTGYPLTFFLGGSERLTDLTAVDRETVGDIGRQLDSVAKNLQGQVDQLQQSVGKLERLMDDIRSELPHSKEKGTWPAGKGDG